VLSNLSYVITNEVTNLTRDEKTRGEPISRKINRTKEALPFDYPS